MTGEVAVSLERGDPAGGCAGSGAADLEDGLPHLTRPAQARRAALASLPSPNSRFMRAGCDSRSGIGSSGPQMVGNENAGPACSCGHAGAHAHLPPFPLYYLADCLPAASNRGQLTSFVRPPISPRISGALVAPRQRIKRHIPSLVAQELHVTCHFCASRAAQTSSQTRPRR